MTAGTRIYSARHGEHGVFLGWLGSQRDIAALVLDNGTKGHAHESDVLPSIYRPQDTAPSECEP